MVKDVQKLDELVNEDLQHIEDFISQNIKIPIISDLENCFKKFFDNKIDDIEDLIEDKIESMDKKLNKSLSVLENDMKTIKSNITDSKNNYNCLMRKFKTNIRIMYAYFVVSIIIMSVLLLYFV